MTGGDRSYQVFVKPTGPLCNLDCAYCYTLSREGPTPGSNPFRMPEIVLEELIVQHLEASSEDPIRFSWHGGEPTLLGLDYFRLIVDLQKRHTPAGRTVLNGIQTNATLLNECWCRFLSREGFAVGVSLDGPACWHDLHRRDRSGRSSFGRVLRGLRRLQARGISPDLLCVVHAGNVAHPLEVYRFFKDIGARYLTFLPLVEPDPLDPSRVSRRSVSAVAFGDFLCAVFDEWVSRDIGRIKVQIFEEAARTAFDQQHSLCIFRETCGDIPVVDHNGDVYTCDHFVDAEHRLGNIIETPLGDLLDDPLRRAFGEAKRKTLPRECRECDVLDMCHGGCPKNRNRRAASGTGNLNHLCAGYKKFFSHCRPFVREVASVWRRSHTGAGG